MRRLFLRREPGGSACQQRAGREGLAAIAIVFCFIFFELVQPEHHAFHERPRCVVCTEFRRGKVKGQQHACDAKVAHGAGSRSCRAPEPVAGEIFFLAEPYQHDAFQGQLFSGYRAAVLYSLPVKSPLLSMPAIKPPAAQSRAAAAPVKFFCAFKNARHNRLAFFSGKIAFFNPDFHFFVVSCKPDFSI